MAGRIKNPCERKKCFGNLVKTRVTRDIATSPERPQLSLNPREQDEHAIRSIFTLVSGIQKIASARISGSKECQRGPTSLAAYNRNHLTLYSQSGLAPRHVSSGAFSILSATEATEGIGMCTLSAP
jgi:hypothetical protein